MTVGVDEARGNNQPCTVEFIRGPFKRARRIDGENPVAPYRYVAFESRAACAVDDKPVLEN
jgi:hypothetical protein